MTPTTFEGLGLESQLTATLEARGYTAPTPIQAALIPTLLGGRDAIGKAPTGTGKTAAFSLPVLQRITLGGKQPQALVLAPTRELAQQVRDTLLGYGRDLGARVLAVYGGSSYGPQVQALRRGVDVVVGTPGRLLDLVAKGHLDLTDISIVVLDEADEMLSMGFIDDIEALLEDMPSERQTVLMSATMPAGIRKLAGRYLNDAVSCAVKADAETGELRQRAFLVNHRDKVAAFTRIFEAEDVSCALIFARTRAGTDDLAAAISRKGIPAESIHGDMNQDARTRVVRRLRNGDIRVLVGTDVAARGLDIEGITHVFNFELPSNPEVFVHRIGRTARAGRGGDAIVLYAPNETGKLRRIERFLKQRIELSELPSAQEIEERRSQKLLERVDVWITRGRCNAERATVEEMIEQGGDPVEIAAAALRIARQAEFSRPVEKISEVVDRRPKREPRGGGFKRGERGGRGERSGQGHGQRRPDRPRREHPSEKEMVAIELNIGRQDEVRVNQLVSTLARHGGVPPDRIGRITIEDRRTLVGIHTSAVSELMQKSGELRVGKLRLDVSLG
ncbi:MAG: DEAD/DEAH box helicase [Rhodothermales bacterium]|nr:DEAD/DEAH box helicase [Rhodothermales bacterium]MBO6778449.1 DEAD/DEAH box helicase [Rhodothermales bacterium]